MQIKYNIHNNMAATIYTKENLVSMRQALPRRGLKLIAEETGFSYNYVMSFFRGEITNFETSSKIVQAATRLIRENEAKVNEFKKTIKAILK